MQTAFYGMAVLFVRVFFIFMSYQILIKVNWRLLFTDRNYYVAHYLCLIMSVAIGHLLGSFTITIIELLQGILFSSFL